jgi:sulfite oxidase
VDDFHRVYDNFLYVEFGRRAQSIVSAPHTVGVVLATGQYGSLSFTDLNAASVFLSTDGGKTWTSANLDGEHEEVANGHLPYRQKYSWTLWEAVIDLPKDRNGEDEFVVKAIDETYNSQPEKPDGIWNVRGILNNSWHRVKA